jgi:hypothetical protein
MDTVHLLVRKPGLFIEMVPSGGKSLRRSSLHSQLPSVSGNLMIRMSYAPKNSSDKTLTADCVVFNSYSAQDVVCFHFISAASDVRVK